MFNLINWPRVRAELHHRALPENIRSYLNGRGIPDAVIDEFLLGWNGKRITIPIIGRKREVLGFRYAKAPADVSDSPEVISDPEFGPELYGWDALVKNQRKIVICDGEFNRLVLEAHGFPAVTSTGGPYSFLAAWLPYFDPVKEVFICFNRDRAGEAAAKRVQAILPRARIVKLPADALDVTDFFVWQEKTKLDFEILLARASARESDPLDAPPAVRQFRPHQKALRHRADSLRKAVKLHELIAAQYATLEARGKRLVTPCLLHDDQDLSLSVYPEPNTYSCSGCGAKGDVVQFLIDKESMTFDQALDALERFQLTGEIYGTG